MHIKNLKKFKYDSEVDVPADTARHDYMEFVVEMILNHSGDTKKPTAMSFQVKWLNYDDTHNSWEPWKNLRLCKALHCDPHTRTGCTGTGVRSDRIEDDPIHPIHCHDTCCVYL